MNRNIPIHITNPTPQARRQEPVSVGVPLPRGMAGDEQEWILTDDGGREVVCQAKALARWGDGSVKWLLVSFLADVGAESAAKYSLRPDGGTKAGRREGILEVNSDGRRAMVDTGAARFEMFCGGSRILASVEKGGSQWLRAPGSRIFLTDAGGRGHEARIDNLAVEESGPVRAVVRLRGSFGRRSGVRLSGRLSFFAGSGLVEVELTIHNPARARHPGNYWDLGDPGAVMIGEYGVELFCGGANEITWTEGPREPLKTSDGPRLQIYQDSSGGENWQSRNHVDAEDRIPLRFRGYRVREHGAEGTSESSGRRASPAVCLAGGGLSVGCAPIEFWQQFPTAVEVDGDVLRVGLLPRQAEGPFELQGGEQNTRRIWFDFDSDAIANAKKSCRRLVQTHEPLVACCDADWAARSGAVAYLPDTSVEPRKECKEILGQALGGSNGFFAKREVIDEFGWRNFGDIWADHEQQYYNGPKPVISHYNNQYDVLHGLLVQFLRTGERRWWELADPLARHIMDVDVYHAEQDKAAYSGGLFWHTAHYHDAGTCTHRTTSRAMIDTAMPIEGGGPANEHNYASGLMLYYHLGGDRRARETAIRLAQWTIDMDDGRNHLLGIVCDEPTGLATSTTETTYHGPGRGAGNSINTLLDAWQASGQRRYLDKAEEFIRRTVHPNDDLRTRDLLNAELRWSYTVYLQALERYLRVAREKTNKEMWQYVRRSLLCYAGWMGENEGCYLDKPEELEFPTETWAAQDLRKGTVLLMAARYADDDAQRKLFCRRGHEILDRAWEMLMSFETRAATRPLAIVLQQGYIEMWLSSQLKKGASGCLPASAELECSKNTAEQIASQSSDCDHGQPSRFVPQKQQVRAALRRPRGIVGAALHAVRPSGWINAARRNWMAEQMRLWTTRRQTGRGK